MSSALQRGVRGVPPPMEPGAWWVVLALLGTLWWTGIGTRSVWTPDEPREYALSVSMAQQSQQAVPLLAGVPFCEKPPLTYWLAAASMKVFGITPVAARLPNLLFGLLTVLATGLLAASMVSAPFRPRAGLISALIVCTAWINYQHTIWLASDAPLLAASAIAMLGAWIGLDAATWRARWSGYALFHLGLAAGFLSKNLLGVIAPVLALLLFVAWERRWQELRRIELWAGALISVGLIGAWIYSVAQLPEGGKYLRVFLLDNSVGRFLPVATDGDYRSGHPNYPGKLVIEIAVGMLPWLFAVIAALVTAMRSARADGPDVARWRFLLVAALPLIALLSFSSTVRDVYALPATVSLAALAGVWAAGTDLTTGTSRICLLLTRITLVAAGVVFLLLALLTPWVATGSVITSGSALLLALMAAVLALLAARKLAAATPVLRGMGIYAAGLSSFLVLASPAIEPGQDLRPTARNAVALSGTRPLLVALRDETITAALYYSTGVRARMVGDFGAAALAEPTALALVEQDSDRLAPEMRARLAHLSPYLANVLRPKSAGAVAALLTAGWRLSNDLPNPGGRHYQLLAPPALRLEPPAPGARSRLKPKPKPKPRPAATSLSDL